MRNAANIDASSGRHLTLKFALKFAAILLIATFTVGWLASSASGFVRSEDDLLKAQIQEARSRARDFKRQQERSRALDATRDRGIDDVKKRRQAEEAAAEQRREKYSKTRSVELKEGEERAERLEKQYEKADQLKEVELDKKRLRYLRKREKVRQVLNRDAQIDEAEEYDLKPF